MQTDEQYMQQCLKLAAIAKANGKTAVGSIVVKDNKIIGRGIEGDESFPGMLAHAEMLAVLEAVENTGSKDLSDCVLYTTVEPCFMCSYLIRSTKIKRIVYGTTTNETGGDSSLFPFLSSSKIQRWNPAPEVIGGVLKEECEKMLEKV